MKIICLDLEGVLVPEIWVEFARTTGIEELKLTTRDIPDYNELMTGRLDILNRHNLRLDDVQSVIQGLGPLEGALEFLSDLRTAYQVIILSDTFYEFARPLMQQLNWPTLLCHRLEVDPEGRIVDYHLRQEDPKRKAVQALKQLNFQVLAAGDSYNDTSMLLEADAGFLFRAPENVIKEFPRFSVTNDYSELRELIDQSSRTLSLKTP